MKKVWARLSQQKEPATIPAEAQQDPVGQGTEWRPLKPGGANFKTHTLVQNSPQQIVFKASRAAMLFYSVFLLIGFGIALAFSFDLLTGGNAELNSEILIPFLFGGLFALVGGWMLAIGTRPIVFDKTIGWYWVGRKKPTEVFNPDELKDAARLADIHAIQILREYVSGSSNSAGYYSYEINLILRDKRRVHVIDHGKLVDIEQDARQLGEFLNCPVWRGFEVP